MYKDTTSCVKKSYTATVAETRLSTWLLAPSAEGIMADVPEQSEKFRLFTTKLVTSVISHNARLFVGTKAVMMPHYGDVA